MAIRLIEMIDAAIVDLRPIAARARINYNKQSIDWSLFEQDVVARLVSINLAKWFLMGDLLIMKMVGEVV